MNSIEKYREGQDDAVTDILEGRLAIWMRVTLGSCYPDYAPILAELHGVELKIVAGCFVDEAMSDYRAGYNAVMETEIKRRFGAGIIEQAQAQAEAEANKPAPPQQREPAWRTPLMILGLPFLVVLYSLLWMCLEWPDELRRRITEAKVRGAKK
jgi:hypothetical protein